MVLMSDNQISMINPFVKLELCLTANEFSGVCSMYFLADGSGKIKILVFKYAIINLFYIIINSLLFLSKFTFSFKTMFIDYFKTVYKSHLLTFTHL